MISMKNLSPRDLVEIAKQMTEVLKENAPSGTGIPSGAKQNYSSAL